METKKPLLQISGSPVLIAEEREKKMWDHLKKRHEELKTWLEAKGMIPKRQKQEDKKNG